MLHETIINKFIEQIQSDIESGDLTAIEEFLESALVFMPEKTLISYLSEERQNA